MLWHSARLSMWTSSRSPAAPVFKCVSRLRLVAIPPLQILDRAAAYGFNGLWVSNHSLDKLLVSSLLRGYVLSCTYSVCVLLPHNQAGFTTFLVLLMLRSARSPVPLPIVLSPTNSTQCHR